jgi:tripartite-type tricarboxylate transporter receptor subunit TctC
MTVTRRDAMLAVAAAFALAGRKAMAADWPTGTVKIVVPFAAGGPTDLQTRIVAQGLSERLHEQFIIENRAGAGGNIGCVSVARSAGDGYTLLAGTVGTHAINEFLYHQIGFDPEKDFKPVAMMASGPNVLLVNPTSGINSVADLIARARKSPGGMTYASAGAGTSNQLAMELFKSRAGLDIKEASYRGAGPAMNDVVAGVVPVMFNGIDNALPMIRSNMLRPLAVSSRQRSPALADVPTLIELGYPDFETTSWTALFAPAATPDAIVEMLNKTVGEITNSGKVAETLHGFGLTTPVMSTAEMRTFIAKERVRWGEAVKISGDKID